MTADTPPANPPPEPTPPAPVAVDSPPPEAPPPAATPPEPTAPVRMSQEQALQAQLKAQEDTRAALRAGIGKQVARYREAKAAGVRTLPAVPEPPSAPPDAPPLDSAPVKVDTTNSTAPPTPPQAPASAPAPSPVARDAEAQAATAPVPAASAPTPVGEAPQAATDTPAPTEAPASKPAPKGLPPEFAESPTVLALSQRDPTLRRSLARIWGRTDISEVQKTLAMQAKVTEVQNRPLPAGAPEQLTALARTGQYEQLGRSVLEAQARREAEQQWLVGASATLAEAAGLDPDDPDFLAAATPEALGQLIADRSPLVAQALERERESSRGTVAQQLTAQQAEHDRRITALTAQYEERLQALETAATANSRATPAAPRGGVQLPPEAAPQPFTAPTTADIRALLTAGRLARQQAQ